MGDWFRTKVLLKSKNEENHKLQRFLNLIDKNEFNLDGEYGKVLGENSYFEEWSYYKNKDGKIIILLGIITKHSPMIAYDILYEFSHKYMLEVYGVYSNEFARISGNEKYGDLSSMGAFVIQSKELGSLSYYPETL